MCGAVAEFCIEFPSLDIPGLAHVEVRGFGRLEWVDFFRSNSGHNLIRFALLFGKILEGILCKKHVH